MDPPPTNNTNIGGKFQIVRGAQVCKREGLSIPIKGEGSSKQFEQFRMAKKFHIRKVRLTAATF